MHLHVFTNSHLFTKQCPITLFKIIEAYRYNNQLLLQYVIFFFFLYDQKHNTETIWFPAFSNTVIYRMISENEFSQPHVNQLHQMYSFHHINTWVN